MRARIISVGDELLKGEIVDTNSAFISRELYKLGIETSERVTCSDDIEKIKKSILAGSEDEKIMIISGGLGPTDDDVTRDGFAQAFGVELIEDKLATDEIKSCFAKLGYDPKERNLRQGKLPKGSIRIKNEWGTAPGFVLSSKNRVYYCLPGVPLELQNIFKKYLIPDLTDRFGNSPSKKVKVLKLFGVPEARVNELIENIEKPKGVKLGFYPRIPEVHITVSYELADRALEGKALNYIDKIKNVFAQKIFAENDEKIEEKLVGALLKNQLTLSVAESCTGGILAGSIVNVSGSSRIFDRGIVSYSDQAKIDLLSVKKETIIEHGAVSAQCAKEMAQGIRKLSGTHIGVSTTGIAGPTGGTKDKPVGTTFIGISARDFDLVESFCFKKDRNLNRKLTMYEVFTRLLNLINEGKFRI